MPLGIEGSAADGTNGPHRGVRLFLFECGSKTVDEGVAVHLEEAGAVSYGVLVGDNQDRRASELGEDLADDNCHSRRKVVLEPLPENDVERTYPFKQVGEEFCDSIPNRSSVRGPAGGSWAWAFL